MASTQTNVTTNSVRFNANTAFTVTIAGTDVITTGGVLITPTDTTAATIFTGGTLNSGGGDLIFNHFGTGVKTVASAIGAATTGLVKSGGGILTLSSPTTTNVYTGNTTIGAGTLRIGVTEQIPNASSVTIAAGASLDLNNLGETINGLSGYGSVVNSVAGTPTLNVGSGGASSTFSGLIVNGTGNVAINKTGAGTLTLNNVVAGSFTGATTISAGAIDIATPLALANNTTINVNAAGGLLFDTTIPTISGLGGNATFALQTTGTAAVPNAPVQLSVGNNNSIATYSGALTGSGTIVKIGNGAQFLAGNNTSTGGVIANNGALVLSGNNTGASGPMIASGGIIQINTSTSFIGAGNVVVATGGTVAFGAVTANPAVVGFGTISSGMNRIDPNSTGVLAVQTDGSLQTPVTENLDFSSAGPGGALNLSLGATMIAATNAGNAPVQYTGVITPNANIFRIGGGGGRLILSNGATLAGANSLFLYGGGTGGGVGNERLFLTAAYGFTGSTTVNAGVTLINTLANGGSASSLGAAGTAASNLVLNGGTLQYIGSGSSTNRLFTISTAPTGLDSSGTGPVNFTGTGAVAFLNSGNRTFTLQGNNTGANTLAAAIGDSVNIAGTSGVLANGTTAITKGGNGTWFLSGANTFSGGVTVNNGVLGFNNLAAIGANTVNGPATVLVNSGGAVALGGSLTTGIQATLNRISPLSTGTVALTANSSENISFDGGSAGAGLPQVTLGAYGSVSYTGTLTPFGTQYRLGGGGGVLTIAGGGLTGPRVLTIGGGGPGASFVSNPNLNGAVVLGGISDYTGGTVLATGGILSATSLTALGTGPLKFQGGFYRAVDTTDITLASDGVSARDIRLGLDSNAASATANIEVVSGVNVTFSKALGALPTFGSNEAQVTLTKFGAGTLTLAGGLNLALSAGGGTTNAGLLIIERGTLSITSNPTFYNGNIQVGSNAGGVGTLKLGANNVFGTGTVAAQGSVIDVYSGSNIDLNGFSDSVRIVRGMGGITNSGASTANLTVGTNSEAEILGGNLSGNFTLTVGGNQTFTFGGSGNVNGLELWNTNSTGFTGKLVVNAGALRVRADGAIGSTTETFAANKITLNNGGVLINGTTLFHPVVIGANHGITIGATGGTISVGGTSAMVINSPITGSGMLTIGDETGTVFLAGTNTYTGGTTISSANTRGFLSIGAGGTTGNLPAGDFLFNTAAGGGRLYFFRSNNMTVPNNINGPGFLLQIGAGTTTLTGNTTTFNSVFVGGGRLKADFSGGNSPISTGATPSVSAGTLEYVGPTGDNTFRLGALTATAFGTPANFNGGVTGDAAVQSTYGGSGIQQLIFNGNARGTAAVTMNFITSGGVNGVTNSIMFEQGPNPKNVIGAAFYFNGADFAAVDLAGFVRAADYGNDNNTNALNSLATVNRFSKLTTSLTTTGLGYSGIVLSGAGTNLTISNAANLTLNANPGALLKSGGGTSIVGGVVGANVSNNNQELILRADTAGDTLQIDLPIIGTGALTKSGNGQLTLTAPNTYTGTTMINQGSVLVTGIGAINLGATGSEIRLAAAAGETAILTIDSAAAVIATGSTANSLRVGEAGSGTLNQSAGSVTAARYLSIGENLGSTGAYNMTGGTLTVKTDNTSNGAALIVGRAGTGSLSIGAGSTVNVNLGAQIQLGTGAVNPGQFQGLIPNVGITTGVGSILQTGGNVNVAVSNGNYQSNVVGGVILGVDGTGSYTLNGGTLTTPALGRGNGLATFTLGSGTLKGAATTSVVPQAIFNVDLPIALTGTGAGRGLIDTSGNDSTFTGALTGVGGFVKASGGALNVLGNGSNYGGGTDITGGSVVSSGTSLGTGNVNVGTGTTLAVQGVQQGLFSKWVLGVPTTVTPGVTTGNTGMVTEFTSLANFNNYLAGKPLVAVESTTARGKVAVNYLEDGVPNGTTAIPPAIVAINNGNNPFIASLGGKFNAAIAGDYTFQLRSDDASAMWIDGNPVLDNNRGQGVTTRTGTITLSAGLHDITIGWANTGGGQGFSAGVTLPGQGQSFTIGNELNLSNDLLSYGSNDLTVGSLSGVAGGSVTFAGGLFTTGGDGTSTGFAGVISNAGNFKKVGAGIQTLTGANTFTGTVTISGGKLNVDTNAALGNVANTVTIENTAVLQAGGTFATNRTVILGPGGGGKIDTNGNTLTLDTGSTVTGTALEKTGAGVLNIKGVQTYSSLTTTAGVTNIYTALGTGTSTIAANATLNIYANQTLASLTIADGIEVTFGDGLPFGDEGGKSGGFTAAFSPPSGGVSGGSSPGGSAVVPEPGSFALLLTGALGLLGRRRRKNN